MKRVTGSNRAGVNKGVSIQLKLGGHSFSATALPATDGELVCELLTPKTLLVPQEEFDAAAAEKLLEAAGMPRAEHECAVWSDPGQTAVAVMAFGCAQIEALRTHCGARLQFTSPLLFKPTCAAQAVWLCRKDDLLYIKVYDNGLRMAEVVTVQTEADLVYYTEMLHRAFELARYELCLAGEFDGAARKMLRRYFSNIRE